MTTLAERQELTALQQTSPDFVPLEDRRPGLYIRSYKVADDGTRYDDSGVTVVESEPSSYDLHPSATFPPCRCPRCPVR